MGAMRVVHLTDIASVGGTLVDALRLVGVDADLIDPIRPGRDLRYPWKAAMLPLRAAGLLSAAARARLKTHDLVHVHYARLGVMGPLCGGPYIVHCHGSDVRGVAPSSGWGALIGPSLRRAARVVYATPDLGPWVIAFRPDARFVPNPVVLSPEQPASERRDLLVAVRLDPIKGTFAMQEIVARVVAMRPATTVTIVDHGREVPAMLAAAGATARLISPVPHAAMPSLLAGHRAAIGQMGVGALGNYELEALGAGLVTAASFRFADAYGEPPPVVDGGSPAATGARIASLLDDELARRQLGAAGRAWVSVHHDPETIARRLAALYAEVLAEGRKARRA